MADPQFSAAKSNLIALVAAGETPSGAAVRLGIHPRTARRWAADPAFREEVARIQSEAVAAVRHRLRAMADGACNTLGKVMGDPEAPASPRVSAAKAVLDAVFRLDELEKLDQIERRLASIEARLGIGR